MRRFEVSDRIRIDIPDQTDPDHEAYHGKHGTVTDVLTDDEGITTETRGIVRAVEIN